MPLVRLGLILVVVVGTLATSPVASFSANVQPTTTTTSRQLPRTVNNNDDDDNDDKAAKVWQKIATARAEERNEVLPGVSAPEGLQGTYYVNGLASCQVGDRLVHPFESHGFFKAIEFQKDGTIELKARYVNTPVRTLEETFQRPLFRGAMSAVADMDKPLGSLLNALSPTTRDTANLAVRKWADTLLVTSDNAPYYSLDTDTLDTLGVETMNGNVLKGYKMLAHTRVDPVTKRLVACALEYKPVEQATEITFFEFDAQGQLVSQRQHTTTPAAVFHDWMITPNYYLIPAAEARFDLEKLPDLILGKCPATQVFALDETAPAKVLLIPRPGSSIDNKEVIEAKMTDGTPGMAFHLGPCHEDENGQVVLNLFVFDRYQFGGEMGFLLDEQRFDPTTWSLSNGGPKLQRWTVVVGTNGKDASLEMDRLADFVADMPTFHPNRDGLECRYVYTVCGIRDKGFFPFNAIAKFDLQQDGGEDVQIWPPKAAAKVKEGQSWDGGSSVWSEPLFVPRRSSSLSTSPQEDDGFLLATRHDAKADVTTLEIFDARRLGDGPMRQIKLGPLWGWNVHSCFEASGGEDGSD